MYKRLAAACLSLSLTVGAVEANAEEFYSQVEYPRLAGMLIANKDYNEPEYMEALSRLDMVVFQFVGAFDQWSDRSMASILSDIKARNPDLVALQYVILNEQYLFAGVAGRRSQSRSGEMVALRKRRQRHDRPGQRTNEVRRGQLHAARTPRPRRTHLRRVVRQVDPGCLLPEHAPVGRTVYRQLLALAPARWGLEPRRDDGLPSGG
jgi:hypothetical protein